MQQRIIAALVLVFLSAACGPSEPAAPPPNESPLYQTLLDSVRESESRLENFRVVCEVTLERPEDWMESAVGVVRKSSRDAAGTTEKLTWAGERYLYEITTRRLNRTRDTLLQSFDGRSQRSYDSVTRRGIIQRQRIDPDGEGLDTFVGLFLIGTGAVAFLEKATVHSIEEITIGGHEGVRLRATGPGTTGGTDREVAVEFDLERGGVPVRVETYDPQFSEGHPKRIDDVLEFREFADGIFLPVKASTVLYRKVDIYINEQLVRNVEVKDATINLDLGTKDLRIEFPGDIPIDDRTSQFRR